MGPVSRGALGPPHTNTCAQHSRQQAAAHLEEAGAHAGVVICVHIRRAASQLLSILLLLLLALLPLVVAGLCRCTCRRYVVIRWVICSCRPILVIAAAVPLLLLLLIAAVRLLALVSRVNLKVLVFRLLPLLLACRPILAALLLCVCCRCRCAAGPLAADLLLQLPHLGAVVVGQDGVWWGRE